MWIFFRQHKFSCLYSFLNLFVYFPISVFLLICLKYLHLIQYLYLIGDIFGFRTNFIISFLFSLSLTFSSIFLFFFSLGLFEHFLLYLIYPLWTWSLKFLWHLFILCVYTHIHRYGGHGITYGNGVSASTVWTPGMSSGPQTRRACRAISQVLATFSLAIIIVS